MQSNLATPFRFKAQKNVEQDEPVASTSTGVVARSNQTVVKKMDEDKRNQKPNPVMLSGNVERLIKWHRIYNDFCFYELIAAVISIQEGTLPQQKKMLLRDRKGPVMQVIYYEIDRIEIDDFHIDMMLRCVGIMVGNNILRAFKIRAATNDEIATLQRFCYISDHSITMLTNNK